MQHFWQDKGNTMKPKNYTDLETKYGEKIALWLIVAMIVYLVIAQ